MFGRRYSLVLLVLLIPVEARAHLHKAGALLGWSDSRASTLGGIQIAGEFMFPHTPKDSSGTRLSSEKGTSYCSLFVYTSSNWGRHKDAYRTQYALAGGGRFTFPMPVVAKRIEVYGHVQGAFVRTHDSGTSKVDSNGGGGLGGGIVLSRKPHDPWVVRAQFDNIWLVGARRYRLISVGLEYRFGSYHAPKDQNTTRTD